MMMSTQKCLVLGTHTFNHSSHSIVAMKTQKIPRKRVSEERQKSVKKVHGLFQSFVQIIPQMLTKPVQQAVNNPIFKKKQERSDEHDMIHVWLIRPRHSFEYFAVQDDTGHFAPVGFQEKHLAEKLLNTMADFYDKPLIIERLVLSFVHRMCDSTSLNLIIFYSHYDKNMDCREVKTKRFWFVREAPENMRFIFEQRVRL